MKVVFSVCPSVRLSICLSIHLSVFLSVRLFICPSFRLSVCSSVRSSVYPPVRLSVYAPGRQSVSVCLSVHPYTIVISFITISSQLSTKFVQQIRQLSCPVCQPAVQVFIIWHPLFCDKLSSTNRTECSAKS